MKVVQRQGKGNLSRLCTLSGYSRQAYYKGLVEKEQQAFVGQVIVQKVIAYRKVQVRIGGRKLLLLLKPFMQQHQLKIGRDAFFTLLRDNWLLIGKRRRGKPKTTYSNHWMRKYPNLAENLRPVCAGGLWVSDITYIDLYDGNGYLSLVTDAYSRKIVGYHLSEHLCASGPVTALEMAIGGCGDTTGLIHHSDRGVQYCCNDYIEILQKHQIGISMTQSGDPRENAIAERVNGILKTEVLKQEVFADITAAKAAITEAVETYNYLRPHSSVAMLTPALAHRARGGLKQYWKNNYKSKPGMAEIMDG
jgi:putative transposase